MVSRQDIKRYRANLLDELNSAALHRSLAANEENAELAEVCGRPADTEQDHTDAWAKRLEAAGARVPSFHPSWITRVLAMLAGRFGVGTILSTFAGIQQPREGKARQSAQYLADQDGSVVQQAPHKVDCRHTISFNHTAIGIENVGRNAVDRTETQPSSTADLNSQLVARHPSVTELIGDYHYRYSGLRCYRLFREADPGYRLTVKNDPEPAFMAGSVSCSGSATALRCSCGYG